MGDALPVVDLGLGKTAKAIAAGVFHTCAILNDDTLKCWGLNGTGQLGLGDTTSRGGSSGEMGDALPVVDLGLGKTAKVITAGASYTCAILDDDTIKCWGFNGSGQLGLGDTMARGANPSEMGDALPPVDLGSGESAVAVATGDSHTCAILTAQTIKCWGLNSFGQLGLGTLQDVGDASGEMGNNLPRVIP